MIRIESAYKANIIKRSFTKPSSLRKAWRSKRERLRLSGQSAGKYSKRTRDSSERNMKSY
jgi:hypothetical protein